MRVNEPNVVKIDGTYGRVSCVVGVWDGERMSVYVNRVLVKTGHVPTFTVKPYTATKKGNQ